MTRVGITVGHPVGNVAEALDDLADRFGILSSYIDLAGVKQITGPDTQKALLRAAGLTIDNDAMICEAQAAVAAQQDNRLFAPEWVIKAGQATPMADTIAEWRILAADDEICAGRGAVPPLKPGVYELHAKGAQGWQTTTLIVAPARMPIVADVAGQARIWGLNLALYGVQSGRDVGLGDYGDLALLAQNVAGFGAAFVGVNPVHALGWVNAGTFSPYSPTHRGFLNTAHIALERICGMRLDVSSPAHAPDMVNYPAHEALHHAALEQLYTRFADHAADHTRFDSFVQAQGDTLASFALFEALSEIHGADWRQWPTALQDKSSPEVDRLKAGLNHRIRFHCWLQWLADDQLSQAQKQARAAGMGLGLYLDLAVGPRRGGAESWCDTTTTAQGVSIGAPPDHLSPAGQNWQLSAFAPAKLSQDRFRGWHRMIAQAMRHAGVFRIDHVLGLNRSFWIPDDGSPGGYIRQPSAALFGLIAIEAARANTVIVGEDLGLVPPGFRDQMQDMGLYGYSVLQYEKHNGRFRPASDLRAQSLACFSTHDTPTLKGYWQGRDIDWWLRLGWIDAAQAVDARVTRQDEVLDLAGPDGADCGRFRDAIHRGLAGGGAAMVSIQMDDLLDHSEAQNLPGTVTEHPNWQRRYATRPEDIPDSPAFENISRIMADCDRNMQTLQTGETENDH